MKADPELLELVAKLEAEGRVTEGPGAKLPAQTPPGYSEAEFTADVLSLALRGGWRRAHFRPARVKGSWRTAVSGDGKGFPDLVLLRGPRLCVVELKIPPNRCTPDQEGWLTAFRAVPGAEVFVWYYPADWPAIVETLK